MLEARYLQHILKDEGLFPENSGEEKKKNSRIIVRKYFILYICLQITNYMNLKSQET